MGEVVDLDPIEVVEVNPRELEEALARRLQLRYPLKGLVLEAAQLLVGDHQKVAGATGGIKDLDRRKAIEQSVELGDAALGASRSCSRSSRKRGRSTFMMFSSDV